MQVDIDKLSDSDKRELQQSLNNEMQKAKIQECAPVSFFPFLSPSHRALCFPEHLLNRPLHFNPDSPHNPLTASAEALTNPPHVYSRARAHRHMLEEVCYGEHLIERLGQEGGAVYTELRGQVSGRQRSCAEASERYERAGGHVRDSWKGRKGKKGKENSKGLTVGGGGVLQEPQCMTSSSRTCAWGRIYERKTAWIDWHGWVLYIRCGCFSARIGPRKA